MSSRVRTESLRRRTYLLAEASTASKDSSKRTVASLQTKCSRLEQRVQVPSSVIPSGDTFARPFPPTVCLSAQVLEVELHNAKTRAAKKLDSARAKTAVKEKLAKILARRREQKAAAMNACGAPAA